MGDGRKSIDRHSRSASERESSPFLREIGSPIKTFGDDRKINSWYYEGALIKQGKTVMEKISARVIVHGWVQGVYFRAYTRDQAKILGLAGWVMNRQDRTVEAFFEGEKTKVEQMVAWCRQGPPSAQVDRVEVWYGEFRGEGDGFEVRYR